MERAVDGGNWGGGEWSYSLVIWRQVGECLLSRLSSFEVKWTW